MKKTIVLFTLLLLPITLTGCFKGHILIKDFSASYEKAWIKDSTYPYGRRLMQLGLPREDRIVLWYLLGKDELKRVKEEKLHGPVSLDIWINNKKIGSGYDGLNNMRVRHFPFYAYGSGRVEILGLSPNLIYKVKIKLFTDDTPIHFSAWTAPKKNVPKSFSFIAYSCYQPYVFNEKDPPDADEYRFYKESVHIANMMNYRASKRLEPGNDGPSFVLGLGDQIYIDPDPLQKGPYALLWGLHSESRRYENDNPNDYFDEVYRRHFAVPPLDSVFKQIPSAFTWDDHEIRDGWGSQKDENSRSGFLNLWGEYTWKNHVIAARSSAYAYQFLRNPQLGKTSWNDLVTDDGKVIKKEIDKIITPKDKPTNSHEMYYPFNWADVAFFIMDLRSQRNYKKGTVISSGSEDKDYDQMAAIKIWLDSYTDEKNKLFVLGSSVPLTVQRNRVGKFFSRFKWLPTWLTFDYIADDVADQWAAIPDQRRDLLTILTDHFKAHPSHRLLVLSGDVHTSQLIYLSLFDQEQRRERVFGHEVVSSGFAQKSFTFNKLADALIKKKKDKFGPNRFTVNQIDILNAPNFAEIFINPKNTNLPPTVRVIFFTAKEKQHLVNRGAQEMDAYMKKNMLTLNYDNENLPAKIPSDVVLMGEKSWGTPHDRADKWFWPTESGAATW